jgi:acyl-CoA synthetase (AMP-forming)/AMP-acid ligase II
MKGEAKIGSIGLPLPDVEARIVETEHGLAERGPREEGELVLSAPQLMKGYWRNAEESALCLRRGADGRCGCTPATSATWTKKATSSSPIARRT